jgi:transposase-like protein
MSPRKLSDADKSDILNLYQHPEETTSTLATRYGVSNSTISRILKSSLLESDYEVLIQQKRSNRTPNSVSSSIIQIPELSVESEAESLPVVETTEPPVEANTESPVEANTESSVSTSSDRRRRRRSSSVTSQPLTEPEAIQTQLQLDIPTLVEERNSLVEERNSLVEERNSLVEERNSVELEEPIDESSPAQTSAMEELLDDDLMDLDEDDLEDDEDDEDDDWDDEAMDAPSPAQIKTSSTESGYKVQVLPLSEASLPKTCYLVVDRAAELIARPLKEFGDLGRIPAEEVQEKTLPVFDNHRVARRFSNRSQRVIKVPDGRMLQKTCSHLQAKGITRLLIDGQVYSLLPAQPPS